MINSVWIHFHPIKVFADALPLRLHASIALISFAFFTSATHAEKLRITSTPKTAVGSRLGHPLGVRLDSISATFTGGISAHPPAGAANLSPELSLEALVALAKPAVVQLRGLQKSGSGLFVTETGVIATNAHVARDEGSLITILPDGQHLEGKVVYIDEDLDIALVKVSGENFPHLALADAQTVRQGESVFAIGNPSGAMQFSMTKGIVSAVGKFREAGAGTWIQTDTPINPGNSGGPLVNMRGEVVGLNTLKLIKKNTTGIAFALSASDLLDVLHRFYPVTAPAPSSTAAPRSAASKIAEMSTDHDSPPTVLATGERDVHRKIRCENLRRRKFRGQHPGHNSTVRRQT